MESSAGNPHLEDRNIVLTGFMGVGKTTVGLLLAEKLQREFLDADQEIEKRHGMPVTEIFGTMGEAKFRQMEKDYIVDLCGNARSKVVSLGGGAFMQEEIRSACMDAAVVVNLDMTWDAWMERQHLLIETRPLLQTRSIEEVRQLFETRRSAYAIHHIGVLTDGLSPEEVAARIIWALRG